METEGATAESIVLKKIDALHRQKVHSISESARPHAISNLAILSHPQNIAVVKTVNTHVRRSQISTQTN